MGADRHPRLVETLSTREHACLLDLPGSTSAAFMSVETPLSLGHAPTPAWLVDPEFAASATLTIDSASAPGSWARAIRHTPHLAAQVTDTGETFVLSSRESWTRPGAPALPVDPRQPINGTDAA